jgi:hypothetical protein
MQIAAGSWILDAMKAAPARAIPRIDGVAPVTPQPQRWTPPAAQGRGLLIDLVV